MNQTVTANISGMVFHIEVDAYDKLKKYLSDIKCRFENAEEREEIMGDIEARVAEIFKSKMSERNQVVSLVHVDEVIALMGTPEMFSDTEQTYEAETETNQQEYKTGKRVYRYPDDKILGGVCSGIALYFGFDPLWLRLAFAIAFFAFGFGFPLYIILWIVIPEAKTRAQKMEMRGEPVTVENIEKNIKKEAHDFENRIKNWEKSEGAKRLESSLEKMIHFLSTIFTNFFKALVKVIGFLLLFFGIIFLVSIIGSAFGLKTIQLNGQVITPSILEDLLSSFFGNSETYTLALLALLCIVLAPIAAMLYGGVKLLFPIKSSNRVFSMVLAFLFISGLGISIFVAYSVSAQFKREAVVRTRITLPEHNVYYVEATDNAEHGLGNFKGLYFSDDSIYFSYPQFDIKATEGDSAYLLITRNANGMLQKEAELRATNIHYLYAQTDSILRLNKFYSSPSTDLIRGQDLQLTLFLPENKAVFLHSSAKKILYDIDNVTNTLDHKMTGHTWLMRKEGLTCVACEKIEGISREEFEMSIRQKPVLADSTMKP